MSSKWELRLRETARSSLGSAYHLFRCISEQKLGGSSHELSLVANGAISEFKSLVSLLDGCLVSDHKKRIRKGPLPNYQQVDLNVFMDSGDSRNGDAMRLVNQKQQPQQCIDSRLIFPLMHPILTTSNMEQNNIKCSDSTGGCHCSKRRKQRIRRTITTPAASSKIADLPADDFSWRKYGQKPIKGSPYPRSYYKCSSMRGCPARKHVERCHNDANTLLITYEGDHNHPKLTPSSSGVIMKQ